MREEEQTPLPPLAVGGVGRSGEVGAELLEHERRPALRRRRHLEDVRRAERRRRRQRLDVEPIPDEIGDDAGAREGVGDGGGAEVEARVERLPLLLARLRRRERRRRVERRHVAGEPRLVVDGVGAHALRLGGAQPLLRLLGAELVHERALRQVAVARLGIAVRDADRRPLERRRRRADRRRHRVRARRQQPHGAGRAVVLGDEQFLCVVGVHLARPTARAVRRVRGERLYFVALLLHLELEAAFALWQELRRGQPAAGKGEDDAALRRRVIEGDARWWEGGRRGGGGHFACARSASSTAARPRSHDLRGELLAPSRRPLLAEAKGREPCQHCRPSWPSTRTSSRPSSAASPTAARPRCCRSRASAAGPATRVIAAKSFLGRRRHRHGHDLVEPLRLVHHRRRRGDDRRAVPRSRLPIFSGIRRRTCRTISRS